ncbi:MAG: NAD-dependent epimerase/dehydratase family protein [Actinobacteria bacterium]|nr:NAD-dependent epimerase/dehydratase family protein [Actinomycetota bacterium]
MKVLITGASGFLGGYIAEGCSQQNDEIRVLVRKTSDISHLETISGIEYHYGDLGEKDAIIKACEGIDAVYHSAAKATSSGTYKQHYEANYLGTINVLDACLATSVKRLVNISSPSTIFDFKDHLNVDESYPYPAGYASHYSKTKAMAEQEVIRANGKGGLTTTSLRPHAIWGPRDKTGFVPKFASRIVDGKFRSIGRGREVLVDMCYVKNAVHACLLAGRSEKAGGRIYFITDGEPVDIWPFIDHLCEEFGLPGPSGNISPAAAMRLAGLVEFIWKLPWLAKDREVPLSRYKVGLLTLSGTYNIDAARRDLGYEPVVSVEEGLAQLRNWVDEIGGIESFIKYVRR